MNDRLKLWDVLCDDDTPEEVIASALPLDKAENALCLAINRGAEDAYLCEHEYRCLGKPCACSQS